MNKHCKWINKEKCSELEEYTDEFPDPDFPSAFVLYPRAGFWEDNNCYNHGDSFVGFIETSYQEYYHIPEDFDTLEEAKAACVRTLRELGDPACD